MKNINIPCDRCGKLIDGVICLEGTTGGYYNVAGGYWQKFQRWDEQYVCDKCMWNDPMFISMYELPPKL